MEWNWTTAAIAAGTAPCCWLLIIGIGYTVYIGYRYKKKDETQSNIEVITNCQCGSDKIITLDCTECNEKVKGCKVCLRRLSRCSCDVSSSHHDVDDSKITKCQCGCEEIVPMKCPKCKRSVSGCSKCFNRLSPCNCDDTEFNGNQKKPPMEITKCQCESENIGRMECAVCHQPAKGCLKCFARIGACGCDEKAPSSAPTVVMPGNLKQCPCGSEEMVKMECVKCRQPAMGCSKCLRRQSLCSCDDAAASESKPKLKDFMRFLAVDVSFDTCQQPRSSCKCTEIIPKQSDTKTIKCQCGCEEIMMMKCKECNQPAKRCSKCFHRLSPCGCDEKSSVQIIKCRCGSENLGMMECAVCHQPAEGCLKCFARIGPCECDEETSSSAPTVVMPGNLKRCPCGNEKIDMMKCAQCDQRAMGCAKCWRRLSSCSCDETSFATDPKEKHEAECPLCEPCEPRQPYKGKRKSPQCPCGCEAKTTMKCDQCNQFSMECVGCKRCLLPCGCDQARNEVKQGYPCRESNKAPAEEKEHLSQQCSEISSMKDWTPDSPPLKCGCGPGKLQSITCLKCCRKYVECNDCRRRVTPCGCGYIRGEDCPAEADPQQNETPLQRQSNICTAPISPIHLAQSYEGLCFRQEEEPLPHCEGEDTRKSVARKMRKVQRREREQRLERGETGREKVLKSMRKQLNISMQQNSEIMVNLKQMKAREDERSICSEVNQVSCAEITSEDVCKKRVVLNINCRD